MTSMGVAGSADLVVGMRRAGQSVWGILGEYRQPPVEVNTWNM